MLKRIFCKTLFLALSFGIFNPLLLRAEEKILDNFKPVNLGTFPAGWKTYPFQKSKAKQVYRVQQDSSGKFLHAEDSADISVPIFLNFNWPLAQYPYLKFRWRAQKLPAGAAENSFATNDSACAVYVGFGMRSAMKYSWSSTLPVGTVWNKKPGSFYIIVKDSGSAAQGQWHEVTINVPEDYKKYFQTDKIKKPSGIGVMTDGNAMHQAAACDYADFRISSTP